jgi:alkyl sulfatase BDS1-like metallo-beta-lactamase superfamily hydrolase
VLAGQTAFPRDILARNVTIDGNPLEVVSLMSTMDAVDPMYDIVVP